MLQHFDHGNVVELCNGLMFDFYLEQQHISIVDYNGSLLLTCGHSPVYRTLAVEMQETGDLVPRLSPQKREPGNEATSDPGFNSVQSILSSFWFFTFSSSLHTIGPGE